MASNVINSHGKGVRLSEVFATLGLKGHSTGGQDLAYACCNTHGRTNPWARYKPVRVGTPATLTDRQFADVRFGLAFLDKDGADKSVTGVTSPKLLVGGEWVYRAPSASDWKRLTDWDGYHHQAPPPFSSPGDLAIYLDQLSINVPLACDEIRLPQDLTIGDFPHLAGLHPALFIYSEETGNAVYPRRLIISDATIGETSISGGITLSTDDVETLRAASKDWGKLHYLLFATSASEAASASSTIPAWPLPCGDSLQGLLTFDNSSPIAIIPTGVAQTLSATPTNIGLYAPGLAQSGSAISTNCFGVGATGALVITGEVTNVTDHTITFNRSNLRASMSPTLVASSGEVSSAITLRNPAIGADNPTMTLAPGESITLRIGLIGLPLMNGTSKMSNPTATVARSVAITINFVSSRNWAADTPAGTALLCIKNGSSGTAAL
ncbi:MAG: hypothetical protein NC342_09185 [Pseudoflavonifractor sp.]|nr:hypothetical protein [Alloprevotella sp.]MCM1117693.1 hypothetical protein [Pseudoflavonifractor sp.]